MMNNFYIKQYSTQPVLTMKVNKDNSVSYQKFNEMIQNSAISFSMKNVNTGIYRVLNGEGGIILKDKHNIENPDEFYIYYKFKDRDVRKAGKYIGEFKIDFFNTPENDFFTGTFLGPIHEKLHIIIEEALLHSEEYNSEIIEIETTTDYSINTTVIDELSSVATIYYKTKNTNDPLFLDVNLQQPLNGYVVFLETQTVLRYYNGYPVEMIDIDAPQLQNEGFPYYFPIPLI